MSVTFTEVVSSSGNTTVVKGSDGKTYTLKGGAGGASSRNNNPGAMKYGPRAKQFGAIGQTAAPPGSTDGIGYAVFPTYNAGVQAYADLQQKKNGGKTIAEMAKSYATDEASPAYANYARDLAAAAGVPEGTKLSDLTPAQFQAMQAKQFEIEGAGTGKLQAFDAAGNPIDPQSVFGPRLVPPGDIPGGGNSALAYSSGSKSDVAQLQAQLKAAGFSPGAIDGINGSATKAAIKAFQTANGLTADGIIGPQTSAVLAATGAIGSGAQQSGSEAYWSPQSAGFPNTQAVKAFQTANGLTADGIIGPQTQAALQKAGVAGTVAMPQGARPGAVGPQVAQPITPGQAQQVPAQVAELLKPGVALPVGSQVVNGMVVDAQGRQTGIKVNPDGTRTYVGDVGSVTVGGQAQGYIDQLPYLSQQQIMDVQRDLQAQGKYSGPIDGIAGPGTKAALVAAYGQDATKAKPITPFGILDKPIQSAIEDGILKAAPNALNALKSPGTYDASTGTWQQPAAAPQAPVRPQDGPQSYSTNADGSHTNTRTGITYGTAQQRAFEDSTFGTAEGGFTSGTHHGEGLENIAQKVARGQMSLAAAAAQGYHPNALAAPAAAPQTLIGQRIGQQPASGNFLANLGQQRPVVIPPPGPPQTGGPAAPPAPVATPPQTGGPAAGMLVPPGQRPVPGGLVRNNFLRSMLT